MPALTISALEDVEEEANKILENNLDRIKSFVVVLSLNYLQLFVKYRVTSYHHFVHLYLVPALHQIYQ